MNRYEIADALLYIAELIERVRAEKTQLGDYELNYLSSAQMNVEEVGMGIKLEEQLSLEGEI